MVSHLGTQQRALEAGSESWSYRNVMVGQHHITLEAEGFAGPWGGGDAMGMALVSERRVR